MEIFEQTRALAIWDDAIETDRGWVRAAARIIAVETQDGLCRHPPHQAKLVFGQRCSQRRHRMGQPGTGEQVAVVRRARRVGVVERDLRAPAGNHHLATVMHHTPQGGQERIAELDGSPTVRESIAATALEEARRRFDIDVITDRFAAIIGSVLGGSGGTDRSADRSAEDAT